MKYTSPFGASPELFFGAGLAFSIVSFSGSSPGQTDAPIAIDPASDNLAGISAFPIVGLQIPVSERVDLFGEFQYQFGLTMQKKLIKSATIGDSDWSIEFRYHYNLTGPWFRVGLNILL